MNKIFLIVFLFVFSSFSVDASVYKGHKLFKMKCLSCHGKALDFVISKTTQEWEFLLQHNGKMIRNEHLQREDAQASMEYFNSDSYKDHIPHFRDFFLEYAADTGNIPACD
ncbi:MAG: hypothetical protein J7J31_04795 [Helicobacteraceae bacterium]|nr:hypothetical protein [Helicobacteraceae bacterium]